MALVVRAQEARNLEHEVVDVGAAMVASDPLDAVVVGAVRRKEVQDDAAREALDDPTREPTFVDTVVVQDDVDASSSAALTGDTATLGRPRRRISRQSSSRVHVGRVQPKSGGDECSTICKWARKNAQTLRWPLFRRRSWSAGAPPSRNRRAVRTTEDTAVPRSVATRFRESPLTISPP
jgi:hypothetical protein